jgi:hypothetical protein
MPDDVPAVGLPVKQRYAKSRHIRAWLGSPTALAEVWAIAEEQSRSGLDRALKGRDAKTDYQAARIQDEWTLGSAAICRDGMSAEGPLPQLLKSVDLAQIDAVTISTGYRMADGHAIRVEFGNESWGDGAVVKVNGDDFDWVTGTFERLSASVAKSESWTRGHIWLLELVLSAPLVAGLYSGLLFLLGDEPFSNSGIILTLFAAVIVGVITSSISSPLRRLFPCFEVKSLAGETRMTKYRKRIVIAFAVLEGIAALATLQQVFF